MSDAVISITSQERMQLEMILLDRDTEGALAFLKVLKTRIEDSERKGMRSHLDFK